MAQPDVMASLEKAAVMECYVHHSGLNSDQFSDSVGDMAGSSGDFKASLMSRSSWWVWSIVSLSLITVIQIISNTTLSQNCDTGDILTQKEQSSQNDCNNNAQKARYCNHPSVVEDQDRIGLKAGVCDGVVYSSHHVIDCQRGVEQTQECEQNCSDAFNHVDDLIETAP